MFLSLCLQKQRGQTDDFSEQCLYCCVEARKRKAVLSDVLEKHADPDELDEKFFALHEELFDGYDCCKCGNCCRAISTSLSGEEITAIAAHIGMERQEFVAQYLVQDVDGWVIPSHYQFFGANGKCQIQVCKPEECKGFPYTDKPDRLSSMYSILSFAEVRPVVYEILERLKEYYHFRKY